MTKETAVKLFEHRQVRTKWDEDKQKWYFAIVDVIAVLTDSPNPQVYWRVLKKRLLADGNETVTNCNGLKMTAPDGKMRLTDVADTEQLLRIIQSIPSPKAEPFKQWLAQVGYEPILQDHLKNKLPNPSVRLTSHRFIKSASKRSCATCSSSRC